MTPCLTHSQLKARGLAQMSSPKLLRMGLLTLSIHRPSLQDRGEKCGVFAAMWQTDSLGCSKRGLLKTGDPFWLGLKGNPKGTTYLDQWRTLHDECALRRCPGAASPKWRSGRARWRIVSAKSRTGAARLARESCKPSAES